jgi:hypothetical protein
MYYNFQNKNLRKKFRKFLAKSNATAELLPIYDFFSIWEVLSSSTLHEVVRFCQQKKYSLIYFQKFSFN